MRRPPKLTMVPVSSLRDRPGQWFSCLLSTDRYVAPDAQRYQVSTYQDLKDRVRVFDRGGNVRHVFGANRCVLFPGKWDH